MVGCWLGVPVSEEQCPLFRVVPLTPGIDYSSLKSYTDYSILRVNLVKCSILSLLYVTDEELMKAQSQLFWPSFE